MRHDEFWRATPNELLDYLDGYRFRQDAHYQALAWQTAYIMNATGRLKTPVTAEKLLGRKSNKVIPDKATQSAEIKKIAQEFEELRQKNGAKN